MKTTVNNLTINYGIDYANTILTVTKTNVVSHKDLKRLLETFKKQSPVCFDKILYLHNVNEYLFYNDVDNIKKHLEKGGYRFID